MLPNLVDFQGPINSWETPKSESGHWAENAVNHSSVGIVRKWFCNDLIFIFVNHISDPIGFQHPHDDSMVLENRSQISNVREMIFGVVLKPRYSLISLNH